jgi:hypothetical protein
MLIVYHLHKPVDFKIDRATTSDAWLKFECCLLFYFHSGALETKGLKSLLLPLPYLYFGPSA